MKLMLGLLIGLSVGMVVLVLRPYVMIEHNPQAICKEDFVYLDSAVMDHPVCVQGYYPVEEK